MKDPFIVLAVGALLGLVLGLLGGGGGILAVPLIVALGEPVLVASTMSLVIVGTGAAAALGPHHRARRVDWPVGFTFGALGSVGAIVGSRAAQRASPAVLLGGLAVMLLLGAVAMLRAARMARRSADVDVTSQLVMAGGAVVPTLSQVVPTEAQAVPVSWTRTVPLATVVGLVTGFFGVGAGFVVVPALISAMHVPVKRATATALVVIVINSGVALLARQENMGPARLTLALAAATAVFGVVGAMLSHRIPGWMLSAAFGTLMVLVGVFTVSRAILAA
jgi:uncharacterized membrane protein YfcA